jgi:hypothetical protein
MHALLVTNIGLRGIRGGSGYSPFPPLRFVYTSDVGLAFLQSNAISIEIFPSFQIAIAGDSDNI